ncbi:hypothetical protein HZA97_03150 [Candidatus Woesearchaeota archaeon]|nr:hypothetical protein [Candidatus Woesearchaeota archaeon]
MYKQIGLEKDLEGFMQDLRLNDKMYTLKDKELSDALKPKIEEFFSQFPTNVYRQERIEELKNRVLDGLPNYIKTLNEFQEEYFKTDKEKKRKGFYWYLGSSFIITFATGNVIIGIGAGMLISKIMAGQTQITPKMKQLALKEKQTFEHWLR